ncbi:MAG: putative glycoside hydrolase [Planctomycetota bacterium]
MRRLSHLRGPAGRDPIRTLIPAIALAFAMSCASCGRSGSHGDDAVVQARSASLALWLAKKEELLDHATAFYDLVMTAWFDPAEAAELRARTPATLLLAGLSHTWIWVDPEWMTFLLTVANAGDPNGPLQITDDMYLMIDDDADGDLDRKCSLPGWEGLYAMDPRHPGWQELIFSFYTIVAEQAQHDGVIVDMVDSHPFCDGAWSEGVPTPIDADTWVAAQDALLEAIREIVPAGKWVFANAGRDFDAEVPFPQHLNGYLLENFLGEWGSGLEAGLASAERALATTHPPHLVVFAGDTNDTGAINWRRFRTGFVASLLRDNTLFAFDYGSGDHGGVSEWWFPKYYQLALGDPLGPYTLEAGVYRRDFEQGVVVIAHTRSITLTLPKPHVDIVTNEAAVKFEIEQGDARIFVELE